MLRPSSWLASLLTVTAIGLAGCHDGAPASGERPSSAMTAPPGLDVGAVNNAGDRFVAVCEELESRPAQAQDLADLREGAATLTRAFRTSPDEEFRRSPKAPKITMRELLRAMALLASKQCGDGKAGALANRLQRVARRKAPIR